jgi:NAD+ kinase
MFRYLQTKGCTVFIDPKVAKDESHPKCSTWTTETEEKVLHGIDLIVVLGGDGTVLHVASQFKKKCPPLLSFNLGSLGFLTSSFEILNYKASIDDVLKGNVFVTARQRLTCSVTIGGKTKELDQQILNDIVIDRGMSPFLTSLESSVDGTYLTQIQADGAIIATPTGSTAYSMSAGGSMCHPSVSGLLLTPICPHSLSFRPIILPDTMTLKIKNSETSRSSAWVSFDGKGRQELEHGDYIEVHISNWPLPAISKSDMTSEWFLSLAKCLHWNTRDQQKPLSKHSSGRMII